MDDSRPDADDVSARALRAELRAWFEREYPAFERAWIDRHGPHATGADDAAWRRAWEDHLCAAGWSALGWPECHGGRDWPLAWQAIFHEEHARSGAPLGVNIIGHGILAPTLLHFATARQQQRFLPGIRSNREIWCQGYSEPSAGSDLASLSTRAVLHGDGDDAYYEVTGHKIWTSFAHLADWCFVLARTDPQSQRHRGISFLLVDMHAPGVHVEPIRQITGGSDFNEVRFDHVRVPVGQRVGAEGDGWRIAMAAASFERGTYFIPRQVRFGQELEALRQLANACGRHDDPVLRRTLDGLALDSHLLRLRSRRALSLAQRGAPPGPEGSATKLHWSEAHQRMMETALDILGERAVLAPADDRDPQAGRWIRDYLWTRAETLLAGTSEIQRNILAEQVLGLPR